jgi:hypothetical protein
MGSLIQNTVFGRSHYKVNTYIGGVGGTINTPALLASKLGIAANRIKLFRVIENDIECAIIGGSYEVKGFNSSDISQVSYYKDPTGIVSGIGYQGFYNTGLVEGYFPNATYISTAAFDQNLYPTGRPKNLLKKLYIPSVTSIGNTVANDNVFRSGNLNSGKIWANPILQTINSGGVEGDLAFLATGNTVLYVTDVTKPAVITNFSVTAIYNTGIQVSFTPPDSINGIDSFEVYVNGVYKQDIKNSGGIVSGLTKNTNYNINLIASDSFYNKSVLSNTLNVTTTNYSNNYYEDTNEATAYLNTSGLSTISDIESSKYIIFQLINNSLWNEIYALYLFKGSTVAQHKWNAKKPLDTNEAFRLVFNGTGSYSSLGFQSNGINAYANTYFNPSLLVNKNNFGLTLISGTSNVPSSADAVEIGVSSTSNNLTRIALRKPNISPSNTNIGITGNLCGSVFVDAKGIFTGSKTSNIKTSAFINGSLNGTNSAENASSSMFNGNIFIGCENNGGAARLFSNQRIQMAILHNGLSDSQVIKLHEIIDFSESIAGRKTW